MYIREPRGQLSEQMTVFHTVGVCAGVDHLGLGPRRGEEFAGPLGFLPLVFHPWIAYLDIIAST